MKPVFDVHTEKSDEICKLYRIQIFVFMDINHFLQVQVLRVHDTHHWQRAPPSVYSNTPLLSSEVHGDKRYGRSYHSNISSMRSSALFEFFHFCSIQNHNLSTCQNCRHGNCKQRSARHVHKLDRLHRRMFVLSPAEGTSVFFPKEPSRDT
jgi:hypothetical protein